MGNDATYEFSETDKTVKIWAGLKQNDTINIQIALHEEDPAAPDDHFGVETFEIPVAEIITSDVPGQFDKSGLKVYDGTNSSDFTFRFRFQMRRIK